MSMINITINNKEYQVDTNISILQACEQVGIELPRFCYHEKLSVAGNCRMCLVEVQKSPKPVVSCAMPVAKDMVIYTETPLVKKAREAVIEFLLVNHPLDCPICDQGGECDLQDETLAYGSDRGRFFEFKRSVEDKECGPIVKTIMTRCIHCTRCVRFSAEIAGNEVLGSFGRGQETEIGTYVQSFIKTELSGNLVDLCPVGALTSKPYSFITRNWELQKSDTIDFFDGVCSDIVVQTRNVGYIKNQSVQASYKEDILRVLPRLNGVYSENWISDRTRYAFDGLKTQRIQVPTILREKGQYEEVSWTTALAVIAESMVYNVDSNVMLEDETSKKRIFGIFENIADLEGLYVFSQILKFYGSSDIQYGNYKLNVNSDAPFFYSLNRTVASLQNLGSLLLIGTNPRFEASLLNTLLRKFQNKNALSFFTLGVYSSLNMKQNHLGNSVRSLLMLTENRSKVVSNLYLSKRPSIILGFENFKNKGGFVLQNIVRMLGKKLLTKTKSGDRFGILHANTATLGLTHLGIQPGVRSILNLTSVEDKEAHIMFALNVMHLDSSKWISSKEYTNVIALGTHKIEGVNPDIYLPITSFYEKNNYVVNVEGRLRKGNKVVSSPLNARNVDVICSMIANMHFNLEHFVETLWSFEDEVNVHNSLEVINKTFELNCFIFFENEKVAPLFIFQSIMTKFYMVDPISKSSSIMGECSLFLEKENNF